MTRTQLQLPDELYHRLKRFAAKQELSLTEIARRGIEKYLEQFPESPTPKEKWKLITFNGGKTKVPLSKLHDLSFEDEANRSLPHDDFD
jgi:hypothetical protein